MPQDPVPRTEPGFGPRVPNPAGGLSGERRGDWSRIAIIGAAIAAISGLHFLVDERLFLWQNILHHLYVLPIMYAALRFGWRGGLTASAAAAVTFLPHALTMHAAPPFPGYLLSRIMAVIEYFLAAAVIGWLSERDRRQKLDLERTANDLQKVLHDLQGSMERMKKSERLYVAGQLSAGLAHEIRNPIASIAGAAGLLQRNSGSEERRRECLEIISKECAWLNRLLTSFLQFARPRTPLFQAVQIEPVLDAVAGLAVHAIGQQPITIRKRIDPGLPEIECDAEQMKQVFLNLFLNAIQAMPKGGEIMVSASARDGGVVIAVRDQGCGMSPENLGRLFDPFFTTKETGTGLGLPVAHQIVAQHGGTLWADPNPEGGMTFWVKLPFKREETA
jgi:signal transduction histidine kinase